MSPPLNGTRLLLAGGSDGAVLAMKPQTGEPVFNLVIAKRGLNTGIVLNGKYAIASHGDENLDSNEMGMILAFDATRKGKLGKDAIKWSVPGFVGGFSSPVIDGDRIYQADNAGNLFAFDVETGRRALEAEPGHRAESVRPCLRMARSISAPKAASSTSCARTPTAAKCLSEVELPLSDTGLLSQKIPEPVVAAAAVARGRVYFVSSDASVRHRSRRRPRGIRGRPSCKPWNPGKAIRPGCKWSRPSWC